MEDIRSLLDDHAAEIAPESLVYTLRGLNYALADKLRDGQPTDAIEKRRHLEMVSALTRATELYAIALCGWVGRHMDECLAEEVDKEKEVL